jgi:hypothetical protein
VNSATAPLTKWILIAGPYRSGTGDHPELLARNVAFMESFALQIFRAGHVPVLGEWLALPLVHAAGSQRVGDEASTKSSTRLRAGFSISAMAFCEWAALRWEPMRWSASHANEGSTFIQRLTKSRMLRAGFGSIPIDAGTYRKCRRIPETGLECRIHIGHGEIRAELYGQRISYVRIQDGSRQDAAHRRTFIAA